MKKFLCVMVLLGSYFIGHAGDLVDCFYDPLGFKTCFGEFVNNIVEEVVVPTIGDVVEDVFVPSEYDGKNITKSVFNVGTSVVKGTFDFSSGAFQFGYKNPKLTAFLGVVGYGVYKQSYNWYRDWKSRKKLKKEFDTCKNNIESLKNSFDKIIKEIQNFTDNLLENKKKISEKHKNVTNKLEELKQKLDKLQKQGFDVQNAYDIYNEFVEKCDKEFEEIENEMQKKIDSLNDQNEKLSEQIQNNQEVKDTMQNNIENFDTIQNNLDIANQSSEGILYTSKQINQILSEQN